MTMKNLEFVMDSKYHVKPKGGAYRGFSDFVLAADIGGTNARFGCAALRNRKLKILVSYHFPTASINDVYIIIRNITANLFQQHSIRINKVCMGAAGPIKRDICRLTNASLEISARKAASAAKIPLKNTLLINDFQAMGYSLNALKPSDLVQLKSGSKSRFAPKVVIGPGTGLGKAIVHFDRRKKIFIPEASEAGHSDFPAFDDRIENDLVIFARRSLKLDKSTPLSYEHLISGRGLVLIHRFMSRHKKKPWKALSPADISKLSASDPASRRAVQLFVRFIARFAKNSVLEDLALGGVYIAGGIAADNIPAFLSKDFIAEFNSLGAEKDILKKVPIYLIKDANAGLLGACFAAIKVIR